MKKLLALLLLLAAGGGALYYFFPQVLQALPGRSTRIDVQLARAGGLEPGSAVTWNEIEIGRVESLATDPDGVRATILLRDDYRGKVPSGSTFKLEREGVAPRRTELQLYVLEPDSEPLADGATVEGVTSTLELALIKGRHKAAEMIDRAKQSEWYQKSADKIEQARTELARIDWQGLGEETRETGEELASRLAGLGDKTGDEAARMYDQLRPEVDRMLAELKQLGRSDDAERLKKRLRELFPDDGRDAREKE